MTKKHFHLFAALCFGALSAICLGFIIWALVEGAVVQTESRFGNRIKGGISDGRSIVYTREDNPGVYWRTVGFLGFFGVLFTVVSVLEHRSYRIYRDTQKEETPSHDLLAIIDHACRLYPECHETLLRARAAVVDLNDAAVEIALRRLLEKAMSTPDRQMALKDIQKLERALNLVGKF